MLERVAPGVFHAVVGDSVTLAVVARDNNGVSAAAFRYDSPANLPQHQVQGHPGCTFIVGAGPRTFTVSVFFVPDLGGARYELFEEDGGGKLTPLGVTASPASGPIVQMQIDGRPKPVAKTAVKRAQRVARKPAVAATRKPAKKKTSSASAKRAAGKGRRGRR